MERFIVINARERKRVRRLFGVSSNYLSEILRFKYNSHKAYAVREYCVRSLGAKVFATEDGG